jgi:altronate hydrolase
MDAQTLPPVIRLHADDGVVIARIGLPPGTPVAPGIAVRERRVPPGHKVATRPHAVGEPIRRYGQIIGFATEAVAPGDWVHTHNCAMGDFDKDYAWGVDGAARRVRDRSPPPSWASAAPTGAWRHATTSAS